MIKTFRVKGKGTQVAGICPKHGYYKGEHCPECIKAASKSSLNVHTHEWVKGVYEHIDEHPIRIESKRHLINECEKRGLYAKAFMKPKSRGKGHEHKR